jgi:ABC-type siderophore export system fused ATPase/permease subunit
MCYILKIIMDKKIFKIMKNFAKYHNISYDELKKKYLDDVNKRDNIKIHDVEKKKVNKRTVTKKTQLRKKKKITVKRVSIQDTNEYEEILEKMNVSGVECYIPYTNGKIINKKRVYDMNGTCIGLTDNNAILFF